MARGMPPATRSGLLTHREVQCLELLGRGLSNMRISEELDISMPTVALHLLQARRKLGAKTREQALILAYRQGLIDP
jgi:DNA-binding CsgD family transcriptional regulator